MSPTTVAITIEGTSSLYGVSATTSGGLLYIESGTVNSLTLTTSNVYIYCRSSYLFMTDPSSTSSKSYFATTFNNASNNLIGPLIDYTSATVVSATIHFSENTKISECF